MNKSERDKLRTYCEKISDNPDLAWDVIELLDSYESLVEALKYVIAAEPTDRSGDFNPINQPQFAFARRALKDVGGEV